MMEEMQKAELERIKKQMRKGPSDPWAVDYNDKVAKLAPEEGETLLDKAKSFSF